MARVKLTPLEKYAFSTKIRVRVTDLNYGNHLGNDRILAYAHEARVQFLNSLGYGELNLAGKAVIMADAAVVYKSEALLGDELYIEVGVSDISRVSFDVHYRITKVDSAQVVALVKTGIVCYDYEAGKVVAIPEQVVNKLK